MPCTEEWSKVSDFLYSGISEKIKFYQNFPRFATPKNLEDLGEAIKIYSEKCILSSKFLKDDYQVLCENLKQRTFEEELDIEI